MDVAFRICVGLLQALANATALSYEAVNVIIFLIILPIVLAGLVARISYLERLHSKSGKARQTVWPTFKIASGLLVISAILLGF